MNRFIFILLCVFSVLLCILFYAFGVATGVSTTVDEFKETTNFLTMLGGWVSGVGALAAVVVTLWLADKQRREDIESVKIRFSSVLITGFEQKFLGIRVVSNGKRPCTIRGLSFECPGVEYSLHVAGLHPDSDGLPKQLNYGEAGSFYLLPGFETKIAHFINKHCNGHAAILNVAASSYLETFEQRIDQYLLDRFNALAERIREQA